MSYTLKKNLFILISILLFTSYIHSAVHDELMYVPENLKPNVIFWEKIYQTVTSKEGLIHDQDSMRIIYNQISINGLRGRNRTRYTRKLIRIKVALLKKMATLDRASWTDEMKELEKPWARELSKKELYNAASSMRFQLGQADRFKKGVQRSGRYLRKIKEEFIKSGLPVELSYLPHVESSFNYKAYSKVGAAGIWQFIRSTGKRYMKVGYVIDERCDPMKATIGATKLLAHNYSRLKSWPLALTAYNHGLRGMQRAVKSTGSSDIGEVVKKYKSRTFGFASRNFYAEFIAAYKTAKNYQKYFGELELFSELNHSTIKLDKYYKMHEVASFFKINKETIRLYNPELRKSIFSRNGYFPKGYNLKVPANLNSQDELTNKKTLLSKTYGKIKLPKPKYYRVQRGDNLYGIARKFRTNISLLKRINNLNRRGMIRVSQLLRLPGNAKKYKKIVSREMAPSPDITIFKPFKSLIKIDTTPIVSRPYSYSFGTVLYTDALNPFSKYKEFSNSNYNLGITDKSHGRSYIKIQVGETIGHIADWCKTSSTKIRRSAGIRRGIRMGQSIALPTLTEETKANFIQKRIEYHKNIEEDFFDNYKIISIDTVAIKRNQNFWTICSKNSLPMWLFLKINNISANVRLDHGTKILLPSIDAI